MKKEQESNKKTKRATKNYMQGNSVAKTVKQQTKPWPITSLKTQVPQVSNSSFLRPPTPSHSPGRADGMTPNHYPPHYPTPHPLLRPAPPLLLPRDLLQHPTLLGYH
jgi:hypothetical protein